jgi:anthranilate phosphoribosyltransferase
VHADEDGQVEDRLRTGIARAEEALDSGAARAALDRWVAAAQS